MIWLQRMNNRWWMKRKSVRAVRNPYYAYLPVHLTCTTAFAASGNEWIIKIFFWNLAQLYAGYELSELLKNLEKLRFSQLIGKTFPFRKLTPHPHKKNVVSQFFYFVNAEGKVFWQKLLYLQNYAQKSKMFLDFTFRVRQAGVYSKEWNMYIFLAQFLRSNKLRWGGALKYWALTQFW